MNLIVAVDENWGIGCENRLLYHLPLDMAFFKAKTEGKVVVMGKSTLLSLPFSRPLANRTNIVLSKTIDRSDCIVCDSLKKLFHMLSNYPSKDIFIIGGEKVYQTLLPYCEVAYITKIKAISKATHFFPNIDLERNWEKVEQSELMTSNSMELYFCKYKNKNVLQAGGAYEL